MTVAQAGQSAAPYCKAGARRDVPTRDSAGPGPPRPPRHSRPRSPQGLTAAGCDTGGDRGRAPAAAGSELPVDGSKSGSPSLFSPPSPLPFRLPGPDAAAAPPASGAPSRGRPGPAC